MRVWGRCTLMIALVAALSGCELMTSISEGAYRNAVSDGTVAELRERGIHMGAPPDCTTTGTESVVRVHCTGRTTTGARVEVTGGAINADTRDPSETYLITLDGHELLRLDGFG